MHRIVISDLKTKAEADPIYTAEDVAKIQAVIDAGLAEIASI